ncbi:MAG: epimerase [Desulfobulbaceae bacterium A2]|nr:MAG: epimerase [Desulfobulbaceae bacterium A2]
MKINNDASKRVLVTGAAGFVGRHCLPILLSKGFDIHAADVVIPENNIYGVNWHDIDLLDTQKTNELIETIHPTHLLHFAWYAKPGEYWTSTENVRWLEGSLHLLRVFQKTGGTRVVMAGTCAEYDWKFGYCSEYVTPLVPSSLYGTCKNAMQHLLKVFSRETGLSSAWGRVFFLYGPHENPSRLVSSVIIKLIQNKTALCSHGNQIRDFLHVKDVASAFVSLLMSDVDGPVNIASGKPIALKEIILSIADKLGKNNLVKLGALPQKENEPSVLFGDTKRLFSEVIWQPQYDIDGGIRETIDWWQERCGNETKSE